VPGPFTVTGASPRRNKLPPVSRFRSGEAYNQKLHTRYPPGALPRLHGTNYSFSLAWPYS
jgi:hypothetical protein